MKRQRGADPIDPLGEAMPELSSAIAIPYPSGAGGSEHYYDPLQPLQGPVENITPGRKQPKKGRAKAGPLTEGDSAQARARRERYDRFIDELIATKGDRVKALSNVYGVKDTEIAEKFGDYLADVSSGMSTSSISDLLEARGAGKAARVALLANHLYSADDKVSLVALKLATDLDGDKHDRGASYENYLRVVMGRT